jgi:hypothetical protein
MIQTRKELIKFQLRAYHNYKKEDVENKTLKELEGIFKIKLKGGLK